jgi:hypothetical protein
MNTQSSLQDESLFAKALKSRCVDIDSGTFELASKVEVELQIASSNSIAIAQMLAEISASLGIGATEIGRLAASSIVKISFSATWLAKLVRAGSVRNSWPQLEDIQTVDKLATLHRVPRKLQQGIFQSGCFPDGQPFRELDREQLAEAVRKIRSEIRIQAPRNPHKEAHRELVRLEEAISQALGQISPQSKYASFLARLETWRAEVKKVTEDVVMPRTAFSTAVIDHSERQVPA